MKKLCTILMIVASVCIHGMQPSRDIQAQVQERKIFLNMLKDEMRQALIQLRETNVDHVICSLWRKAYDVFPEKTIEDLYYKIGEEIDRQLLFSVEKHSDIVIVKRFSYKQMRNFGQGSVKIREQRTFLDSEEIYTSRYGVQSEHITTADGLSFSLPYK